MPFLSLSFLPDGRTKGKQYACRKSECQKRRKKENQAAWLARHPGYLKGRYPNTRKWLDGHPGYLTDFRVQHPEAREKHVSAERERRKRRAELAVDIQDLKSLQDIESKGVTGDLPSVDIQDSTDIRSCPHFLQTGSPKSCSCGQRERPPALQDESRSFMLRRAILYMTNAKGAKGNMHMKTMPQMTLSCLATKSSSESSINCTN